MQYAKSLVGAVIAGLGAAGTALADGHITAQEWTIVASVALVALGAIWGIPNKTTPAPAPPAPEYRDV